MAIPKKIIMETKKEGFKVWDVDNKKYLLDGTVFDSQNAAIAFAGDWLKTHHDKYNENSRIEIHKENK